MICIDCERHWDEPDWKFCPTCGGELITLAHYNELCDQVVADAKADEAKVNEGRGEAA